MADPNNSYKVFLIGDTGKPNLDGPDDVLELLKAKLAESGEDGAVIFLGDNIYPKGLPPLNDEKRAISEKRISVQLDAIKTHPGKIFFISGNHDWNKGKRGGLHYVRLQQKFIENYLQRDNIYLPSKGCPGPVEVIVNDYLRLVFINTQWWIQKGRKPIGQGQGCVARSEEHFFQILEEMLQKDERQTIVVGHHPVFSKAMHGGHFSTKQHIFPLRFVHKHLYIPLPGPGSLYPLYRKYFGAAEDISYPPYRRMRNKLLHLFRRNKNLIYVSGHDHNLQYIKKGEQHFLISGSGSKAAYVKKGRSSVFSYAEKGFIELTINTKKEVEIIAWQASPFNAQGNILYKGRMIPFRPSNTFTNYYLSS